MNKPLHIVFNEDIYGDSLGDKFSARLDHIKLPYLQVKDINQFELLLSVLPADMTLYVWVHPNNSLKKEKGLDYTNQEDIAHALKLKGNVRFNLVTRMPNPETTRLAETLGVSLYKVGSMWDIQEKDPGQKVTEITKNESPSYPQQQYRYAVISALFTDEFQSLQEFLEEGRDLVPDGSIKSFRIKNSDKYIVCGFQPDMGMVDAANLSSYLIHTFHPEYLFMNGVCGGRRSKGVSLLDIVIPGKVVDYQTGKLEGGVFKPYLRGIDINTARIRTVYETVHRSMQEECTTPLKEEVKKINFHFESMACGSKVIKTDAHLEKEIAQLDEKTVAVDMESYSVVRAAWMAKEIDRKSSSFIIKSVMDFTDEQKGDKVKKTAAYFSSLFTVILIRDHL
jgi:nucleoside phosphorylase